MDILNVFRVTYLFKYQINHNVHNTGACFEPVSAVIPGGEGPISAA